MATAPSLPTMKWLHGKLGAATCFTDLYSSWQQGSHENRSGMIRRRLPERSDIRPDMVKEMQKIVDENNNNRPIRVPSYTSTEAFIDESLNLQP